MPINSFLQIKQSISYARANSREKKMNDALLQTIRALPEHDQEIILSTILNQWQEKRTLRKNSIICQLARPFEKVALFDELSQDLIFVILSFVGSLEHVYGAFCRVSKKVSQVASSFVAQSFVDGLQDKEAASFVAKNQSKNLLKAKLAMLKECIGKQKTMQTEKNEIIVEKHWFPLACGIVGIACDSASGKLNLYLIRGNSVVWTCQVKTTGKHEKNVNLEQIMFPKELQVQQGDWFGWDGSIGVKNVTTSIDTAAFSCVAPDFDKRKPITDKVFCIAPIFDAITSKYLAKYHAITGNFYIFTKLNGMALDVYGGGNQTGTQMIVWPYVDFSCFYITC